MRDASARRPVPAAAHGDDRRPLLLNATALARQVGAELLGTGLLVAVVIGSGIAAERLSPGDVGLQLLENALATAFGLAALILLFQPLSGAHFNPVVTIADRLLEARHSPVAVVGYIVAQITGAVGGAALADAMFGVAVGVSTKERADAGRLLGEVVATAVLVLLVFALGRTGRGALAGPAVAAFIGAAYWFTSSTSFANPAVTIGRVLSDTFAGIAPLSALAFIGAQLVGGAIGVGLTVVLFPRKAHP